MPLVPYSDSETSDNEPEDIHEPARVPSSPITRTSLQSPITEPSISAPKPTLQNPQKRLQRPLDRLIRPEHAQKLPVEWKGRERVEEALRRLWDIIHSNAPDTQEYVGAYKKLVALTEQLGAEFKEWQQRHPALAQQALHRARRGSQQQEPRVEELLAMLRGLVLNGCHSQTAFYDADNTTFEKTFSKIPIADYWRQPDYYNEFEIDLDTHCSALDAELELNKQRWNRIQSILTSKPALEQALITELDELILASGSAPPASNAKPVPPTANNTKALLHEKMTALLLLEKKATARTPEPTFPVTAVTTLHPNGKPSDYLTYHLPHTTTWPSFLDALKRLSTSWQAPNGYGPEDGLWRYQRAGHDGLTELADERAYRQLRQLIIEGEGRTKVTLWHSVQVRRAEEGLRRARELADRRSISGVERVDGEGKWVFERWFDLEEYLGRMRRREREARGERL